MILSIINGEEVTEIERFEVEEVLKQIETKLRTESNSCEYKYYLYLRQELIDKLKE